LIPTASYGQNLFQASKGASAALFPNVDIDGYAKPAILILVEEAINAEIEEIYIIVSEHDKISFENLFYNEVPIDQYHKLNPQLQMYCQQIIQMGRKIKLIEQHQQEGLGHAVYLANNYTKGEPFLLMLGDHLYRSNIENQSCVQQLINEYKGINLIGLRPTLSSQIHSYGTVTGQWIFNTDEIKNENQNNENQNNENKIIANRINITEIVEKPDVEYAKKHLKMMDMDNDMYLTVFGLYILESSRLMEILENDIKSNRRKNGLFQLTTALDTLRKEQELRGYIIDGKRFDIGASPQSYQITLAQFSSS